MTVDGSCRPGCPSRAASGTASTHAAATAAAERRHTTDMTRHYSRRYVAHCATSFADIRPPRLIAGRIPGDRGQTMRKAFLLVVVVAIALMRVSAQGPAAAGTLAQRIAHTDPAAYRQL